MKRQTSGFKAGRHLIPGELHCAKTHSLRWAAHIAKNPAFHRQNCRIQLPHIQPAAPKGASRPTIMHPCIRNTTVLIIDWRMRTIDNTRSQLQLSRCRGAGALAYLHSAKIAMCFLIQLTRRSASLCNSCGAQRFFCTVHFYSRHSPHMISSMLFLIQTGVFALCIFHRAGTYEG